MPIFLHIDTALETAFVALSKNKELLAIAENTTPNTHAEFVQTAIDAMLDKTTIALSQIDAIVVTLGPGSYTGLRVGLASAKGIAYAIDKPLIGLSTLDLLRQKAINTIPTITQSDRIFSMIDARRMEVFGALYDYDGTIILPAQAIIIDQDYMETLVPQSSGSKVYCIGSGSVKASTITNHTQIHFIQDSYSIHESILLASIQFSNQQFIDLAYSAPTYIKEFYMAPSNKK